MDGLKQIISKSSLIALFILIMWIGLKGMFFSVIHFDEIKIYQLSHKTGEKWFAILEPSSTIVIIKEFDVTREVQVWNLKGTNSRHIIGPIYTPHSKYWPCIYINAQAVWDIETHPEVVYTNRNSENTVLPKNNNCTLVIYDESIQLCDKEFQEMIIGKNELIEFVSKYNISKYVNSIP